MFILNPSIKTISAYQRQRAISYAHKWAYNRNPRYYDFSEIGGDCTNFASQVIYAGSNIMNHTRDTGWYYININNRAPAWTGVNFLYSFLINNKTRGPFAEEVDIKDIQPGDIIQLSFQSQYTFNHSPVVVQTGLTPDIGNILVAAHTDDRDYYPLTEYEWAFIRFIHIKGVYT